MIDKPDLIYQCCVYLIKTMIETNATKLEQKLEGFHDNDGKVYGDYIVTVKKLNK